MKIDISDVYSLDNKEITRKVHIDMAEFQSRQGTFPIQAGEPFDLTIAWISGSWVEKMVRPLL